MNGGVIIPDKETAKALNDLARHKAIVRILSDIRMDMEICEIEGWDKNEYLNLIRQLLNSIGDKTMDDLISRQAAIDAMWELRRDQQMLDDTQTADIVMQGIFLAEQRIKNLPSAQPEIIRCKDCKHNQGSCCDYSAVYIRPNGYCQWAERKDDEVD